jgi:hypothetical protein
MKTPIQELIETFEEVNIGIEPSIDVQFVILLVKSMLKKEKQAIMNDFIESNILSNIIHRNEEYAEHYYNDLYEQD